MNQTILRIVGFEQATCGCIFARYRYVGGRRELFYVEAAATGCSRHTGSERFEDVAPASPQPPLVLYSRAAVS